MSEMQEHPRFSGTFSYTKKSLLEIGYAALPLYTKILFPLLGLFLLGMGLYYLLGNWYKDTRYYFMLILSFVMSFYSFLRVTIYVHQFADRTMKRIEEMGKTDVVSHTALFEDHFVTGSTDSTDTHTAAYDHLIRMQQTKHFILLWRPQKLYQPIEKATLEGGSAEELKAFLKEKNPQIRMR